MAKAKKPSTSQVMAWLYNVVGPILSGLRHECYFLGSQKTPTWRFRGGRCEFVHRVAAYVDAGQHPTLTQFLRFNPKQAKRVEAHDTALAELETAAAAAHAALVKLPQLVALVAKITAEFPDWRGAYKVEDGANLLAENVVNLASIPELPSHYTNAAAWKKYGPEAVALRKDPSDQAEFERLDGALAELTERSSEIQVSLTTLREKLADEHGLPPVPADTAATIEHFETF